MGRILWTRTTARGWDRKRKRDTNQWGSPLVMGVAMRTQPIHANQYWNDTGVALERNDIAWRRRVEL